MLSRFFDGFFRGSFFQSGQLFFKSDLWSQLLLTTIFTTEPFYCFRDEILQEIWQGHIKIYPKLHSKFQQDFPEILASEVAIFGHIFATYVTKYSKAFTRIQFSFLTLAEKKLLLPPQALSQNGLSYFMIKPLAGFLTIKWISSELWQALYNTRVFVWLGVRVAHDSVLLLLINLSDLLFLLLLPVLILHVQNNLEWLKSQNCFRSISWHDSSCQKWSPLVSVISFHVDKYRFFFFSFFRLFDALSTSHPSHVYAKMLQFTEHRLEKNAKGPLDGA